MTIVQRDKVLAAFERAFLLDPLAGGFSSAIRRCGCDR
jgi:hypothetical protein